MCVLASDNNLASLSSGWSGNDDTAVVWRALECDKNYHQGDEISHFLTSDDKQSLL